MTSPTVKLVYGALELNLNDQTEFGVYPDFTPPDIAYTVAFAGGTSANTSGGAELANKAVSNTPFSFRVNVLGSSDADIRKNMGRIRRFLAFAEDQSKPLYLEFNSNSNIPRPLWGQGFFIRYQIAYGTVEYDKGYLVGASLSTDVDATLNLVIKGYPVGLRQRLGSAMGRIVEDVYGAADGISRGLHVPPSITNKMTNPVFGSATYSTGWTADASLTASQNTDARYVLPGAVNSAKLFARATGQEWYQSINAGNTNTHTFVAIVCLPDLGTPSSSDCELFYSTTLTTTFVNLGNGYWRLTATAAGINAATNTGVQVKNGRAIYLCYFGMIEGNNGINYQPIWGDHLGCAWSGTAHASTSTSTAGRWRQAVTAETFDYQQGALRIVWTPPMIYSSFASANYYLFDAGSFIVFFDATNDVFTFYDGTNSASIATTFAADTPIVIHCVWGPSGKLIYINGVSATNTYTPPAAASYFYLGSSSTPSLWAGGVFGDLTVWGVALTATQIANDYANVAQLTADNQLVGCIPWEWDKDGDAGFDNCDDSTHDNWGVCGGIPGSAPAWTYIRGALASNFLAQTGIWINNNPMDVFIIPTSNYFFDYSGTVVANTCGGEVTTTASVTTTPAALVSTTLTGKLQIQPLYGKTAYMFVRMADNGANLLLALSLSIGGESQIISTYKTVTTDTSYRSFLIGPVSVPNKNEFETQDDSTVPTLTIELYGKRSTGSGTTLVDYAMLYVDQFCKVPSLGVTSTSADYFRVYDGQARIGSSGRTRGIGMVWGKVIELNPSKLNVLTFLLNDDGALSTVSDTLNSFRVDIIPRYHLL